MKIGIFGKGRLAAAIVKEAPGAILWQITREAIPDRAVDVAIEVSGAAAVPARIEWAIRTKTPLVIGTTGWSMPDLSARVGDATAVLSAPNFSLTVALYRRLTAILARFAAADPHCDPYIVEHHHARKKDAPSGTARLLAETVIAECPRKSRWAIPHTEAIDPDVLSVSSVRAGTTYSSHIVGLDAPGETIELHHSARDASPYAKGAIEAARWLLGKKGVFSMEHVAADRLNPLFAGGRS